MNWRVLRQWLGPVLVTLMGLLAAGFARAEWITNLVFQGNFHFDLSALLFFIGLLAGLTWVVVILVRQSLNRRVEKALAEERVAQGQERQRFLRRLDHELKNPLTTIRLGIANLKEDPSPGEEMTGSLERISHQAQRLQTLVENLRRF